MPGPITRRRVAVVCAIAALVVIVSLMQTTLGGTLLTVVGINPSVAPFLELYFADPGAHPDHVHPGQQLPVSFVMSSHGSTYVDLTWRVETIEGQATELVATGTHTVPDGESTTITTTVPMRCAQPASATPRTQIRVSVVAPAEQISFWVTCVPAGS